MLTPCLIRMAYVQVISGDECHEHVNCNIELIRYQIYIQYDSHDQSDKEVYDSMIFKAKCMHIYVQK